MKKKNLSKFIIGLSTTALGGIMATSGQVAYASETAVENDVTTNNQLVENVVDDYSKIVDVNELAGVETTTTADDTKDSSVDKDGLNQESVAYELNSKQALEENANLTDENKASTTNETEQKDTAENNDQALEATSGEEALLTEPTASSEDPAEVKTKEPSTVTTAEEVPANDENLDAVVDAGVVVEDEDDADTARTEADPVDEDSTEKARELEANTTHTTNNDTAAATNTELKDDAKTSADSPQETLAADEPLKKSLQAGDALLDGDGLPITEGGSELPEIDNGAESSAGDDIAVDIAVKEGYTDPEADAAKIENKRETDLTPGDTVESGGIEYFKDPEDGKIKPKDGFKPIVIEPKNDSADKRLYGYELIIDKETGQRTYTWIQVSSGVVRTSPATLGNKPMMGKGYKDSESSSEVIYEPTGPSTLSPGSQNVYGYKASKDDLEFINDKDIKSAVLSMKDRYTKDNVYGPQVLANANFEFSVNPWPDENDNLEPIRLQGNYDENKKVYVHGQEIDTGLKVENLDENARERLTAKVYYYKSDTKTKEIVPGAEVYIDGEGNVKVKLPDGAVDKSGNINPNSIFYDDPKFNGAQSLDVQLYARPRTAQEFQDVADLSWFAPGTYTDTGAGTTKINHKGATVEIANQGIDRYDHYNLIGEFEINLDDESNYDIITKDITADKLVTDKVLRLKAGVDKEIEQVDNQNSTAPHKYTTAITDKAVDSYLEEEYKEYLIPVEGEKNKYRTEDNWLVEVDPDNPQNMKVSTPIGAKKGENLTLAITHLFTNGSEKNFLMNFVVKEESIEKPDYKVAVTKAGEEVTNTPTNNYTEEKPKPVKYELESTSIVDDNGKTWTLSIDEDTGVITATAPGEIDDDDKVSTINATVIATYKDQKLKDINGKDLVYTERSNATFTATAPQEGEVKYSQDNTIEYETIVRYNPDKDPTESGVVQEGKNGKSTADYTVTYKDGEVVKGPTKVEGTEKVTVKPTDQIFEIGTKGASVDVTAPDEQTIKIPHTTEIIYDANQPVGYRKETPGEDGEKKITYEITQENGKATVKATESTTKPVTPRRIVIGTKPSELEVDFNPEIDVKVDNTKEVGSVDTEVVQGEYKTVTKNVQNPDGSIVTIEEVVEITKPKQIITVGTKDYTGDVSHTDKKDVPFEVRYEYTNELDAGVTELKNDGVLGEKTVTYTVPVINGKKDPDKEVTSQETQTKDPVDKVILVGTRPVEKTIEIPFETEYVYDSSLEAGQTVTDENNPGVTGQKKVTTSFNQTTNDIVVTEETVTEAQKRIVRVGGKTTGKEVITEDIAYNTRVIVDPNLKKGEWEYDVVDGVAQTGKAGTRTITVNIENSKAVGDPVVEVVQNAVDAVIRVGSEDFTGTTTHTETQPIPFTTRIVNDPTMAPGTSRVETKGVAGQKTIEYSQAIRNGQKDGELVATEIEANRIEPTEEVIHVGTKPITNTASSNAGETADVDVEITYTYDNTRDRGTAIEGKFTPGKVETIVENKFNPETGQIETTTRQVATKATQEIIVGTKDYTGTFEHVETETTPYKTIIVHDPSLAAGESRTDQQGIVGKKTRTVTQNFVNGDIASKSYSDWTVEATAQDEIIRVGSLSEGKKSHEESIPFGYKVEYDSSIAPGKYEIVTPGKEGKKVTEWNIRNSEVVGDPTVKVTEQPVDAVIKVSNQAFKGEVKHTETFVIPYQVVIRENSALPVGERKLIQEGKDGSYKVTYKQAIENGQTVGELTREISDEIAPQNQIIEIGTKAVSPTSNTFTNEVRPEIDIVYTDTLDRGVVEKGDITPGEVKTVITTTRDPQTGEIVTKEETVSTAPRQEIRVGTKDFTGEYKYTEEKIDEYKTTVVFDDTLAPGEEVIDKQGINGVSRREVTVNITNGQAATPSYGDYEEVTKRQDQVIRVGTKTDGKHTVTEEVPYGYTIVEVDTLKKGEYKEVTPGQAGSKTTEYEILNSKVVEGSATVVERTAPVDAVIHVGKGTLNGSHTVTETEVVPNVTEIVFDDTLKAGEQVVDVEGSNGSKSRDITLTIQDGKVVSTDEGEYTQTSAPVNRKIRVGTQTSGTITHEEKIPFTYEITYDPTVAAGTYVTDVEGKEGTRTTTWTITNSAPVKTGEVTEGPTNAKIRVGTKDFTGTVTNTTTEPIPYKVIVRENPNMKLGTSKTVTDGVVGSKDVTYNIPVKNGAQDPDGKVTKSEEIKTEAVDQVIEVGTKIPDAVSTNVGADNIGVDVVYEYDPNLELGKTREGELTPGKVENTVTTRYNPETGKLETVENKTVTNAKQVIYIGTKALEGKQEFKVTQEIPFTTRYENDPTLDAGETRVDQHGVNGEKTVTYTAEARNGSVISHGATEVVTKAPVEQVIKVGTKPSEPVNTIKETTTTKEQIPFTTIYKPSDELDVGEVRVETPGKMGVKNVTIYTEVVDGVEKVRTSENVETEPVAEVVLVGTRTNNPTTEAITKTTTETIPFKTITIEDPNLEVGTEIVDVEGVDGEKEITITIPSEISSPDDLVVKESITKESTPKVVRVGTKKTTTRIEEKEVVVPYETEIILDETLKDGEREVDQDGQTGTDKITTVVTIVNGQDQDARVITTERTKDPVKEIVRVGTRRDGSHSYEEDIPFEVTIIEDKNLKDGEYIIEKEGVVGKKTTTWEIVNSQVVAGSEKTTITKPAENAVIRVGTADHTGKVEYSTSEELPFEVEIVQNPDLAIGKHKVRQEGIVGSLDVTYEIDVVNGKASGEPKVKTSDRVAPVKQIIEVGTKPVEQIDNTITTPLQPDFKVIYDNTKDKGTVEVGQLTPGKVETKITQTFNPETGQMESKEETVVTNPTQTITIGTKDLEGSQSTEVTKVIPFETEYIYDNTLASGERVVDQQGSNGVMTVTYTTKVKNGSAYDTTVTENVTTEPTKQIVRIGTKEKVVDTKTYTTVTNIPYETKIEFDPELPVGEKEVVTKGQFGEETTTITVTNNNGTVSTTSNTETTKNPVNEVIKVGTKIDRETKDVVSTNTYEIPFETKVTYDPNLKAGEEIVKVQGENGSRTVTVTVPVVEGKAGEPVVENKVTKEPITREVVIGTMDTSTNTSTVISITKEEIPFEIEYVKDDTLEAGETRVETVGKNGKKITTTTLVNENGKSETKTEETTEDAVKQVVRVGTKVEDKKFDNQDFEKKFTQEIPFATEIEYDENLAAGTEQVVQDGKNGSREITVKVSVRDGIASEPVVTDNITPATPKKVKIGTMKTDTVTTVTETVKPFETEIVYDNTMDKGTSKVTQTGVNGKEIKTTVTTVINGKAQENPVVTTSSTEPTKQIITVGTKCPDSTTTVDTIVEKVTPYEVTIIYDDTLAKGTEVVVTEGRVGIVRETHTVEVKNGVTGESKITKTETIQEKQDKVIRIGTKTTTPTKPETPKVDSNEIVSVTEVPEQFETEIIYDDTLPAGKVVEEQKGINGVRTITTTIKITDGKAKTIVTEEVTKEAKKRIIRVGTKSVIKPGSEVKDVTKVEIPYDTIVTYDPTLEIGKQRIISRGIVGEKTIITITKIVDGKEVVETYEEITRHPVNEYVVIGTMPTSPNENIQEVPTPSDDDPIIVNPDFEGDDVNETIVVNPIVIPSPSTDIDVDDVVEPSNPTPTRPTEEAPTDSVDEEVGDEKEANVDGSDKFNRDDEDDVSGTKVRDDEDYTKDPSRNKANGNPKTGITGSAGVLATLGLSMAGLAASKKKKDEEEN